MMNRAERREYNREMRKNKMATFCPTCKVKTLKVAVATKEWLCNIVCECCGKTIAQDVAGFIPHTYVKWPLTEKDQHHP